jgi:predicted permease
MLNGLWRDLALAARSLTKARAFSFVCVVSLGIGMTPVIAIPYASRVTTFMPPGVNTDGLVQLVTTSVGPHQQTEAWSYPDYLDLRDANTGVTLFGSTGKPSEITLPNGGTKLQVSAMYVPANYFKTLGVALARGAGFDASADDPLRAEPVVILTDQFWQNHLNADPDIVGKTLKLDGTAHVIVGVAPDQFVGHVGFSPRNLFVPLERHPRLLARAAADADIADENVRDDRSKEWLAIEGRLSPGVSVQQASTAVAGVTARLAKAYPATNEFKAGIAVAYDPLGPFLRPQLWRIQAVALTLTGMVLLVVSLNISGMMLVRGAMRERELSIRQAIGATRWRLAQYLLSESIVLACAGGALATLVLYNLPALVSWLTGNVAPAQVQEGLGLSVPIVAITFGICLLTSLVFGWLPALRFSRPVIISSLKDDAGGGGGVRAGRVHRVTAALQVAIAVPLLVMSGQSLVRMRATAAMSLGFEAERVYAAPLTLDGLTVENSGFQIRRLSDTLAQTSGVDSVTVADGLPLDFQSRPERVALKVETNVAPRPVLSRVTRVGNGYLDTLGIPLLRGRSFTVDDRVGAEPVTVVSKTLADRLASNGDVVGKQLTYGADGARQRTLTIVGVTADFPTSQMSTTREQLLLPLAQHPGVRRDSFDVDEDGNRAAGAAHVLLIAKSAPGESPKRMTAALENVARELDPDFQPSAILTGTRLRQNSMNDFLTQSAVAGGAGSVILLLAALGIYGVVGLMVATRTREIAMRAALGASRRRVLGMIIFDVVKLVLPGVGVGVVLTVVFNRLNAQNMGIELNGLEPLAYVGGAAVAVLVAILASLAPARRAASVQPMVAMRSV